MAQSVRLPGELKHLPRHSNSCLAEASAGLGEHIVPGVSDDDDHLFYEAGEATPREPAREARVDAMPSFAFAAVTSMKFCSNRMSLQSRRMISWLRSPAKAPMAKNGSSFSGACFKEQASARQRVDFDVTLTRCCRRHILDHGRFVAWQIPLSSCVAEELKDCVAVVVAGAPARSRVHSARLRSRACDSINPPGKAAANFCSRYFRSSRWKKLAPSTCFEVRNSSTISGTLLPMRCGILPSSGDPLLHHGQQRHFEWCELQLQPVGSPPLRRASAPPRGCDPTRICAINFRASTFAASSEARVILFRFVAEHRIHAVTAVRELVNRDRRCCLP